MLPKTALTIAAMGACSGGMYYAPHVVRYAMVRGLRKRCARARVLVLTYDDGPGLKFTPRLLDLLEEHHAPATFFMLGDRARHAPDVVDQVVSAGHEIGCHGEAHVHGWKVWPWRVLSDIEVGYKSLAPWMPADGLFRPPYGKLCVASWLATWRRGRRLAWWTADSGDTHAVLPRPQAVADSVARAGGGVVLMHDFDRDSERERYVLETTELLIRTVGREGMTIQRMCELLGVDRRPRVLPECEVGVDYDHHPSA